MCRREGSYPPMSALRTVFDEYRTAFRDEPKLRAYALASFVDDLGVAVTAWATTLMMTNLFTSQRERARRRRARRMTGSFPNCAATRGKARYLIEGKVRA